MYLSNRPGGKFLKAPEIYFTHQERRLRDLIHKLPKSNGDLSLVSTVVLLDPINNTLLSIKVQFDICKCTDGLIFILRMPGLIILPQDPFGRKITQFWVDFARYKACWLFWTGSIGGLKGSKLLFIHPENAWCHKTGLQTQWKLSSRPRYN